MVKEMVDKQETNNRVPKFNISRGCPIRHLASIEAKHEEVSQAEKFAAQVKQASLTHPLQVNSIHNQLSEVGDVVFMFKDILQQLVENIFILHHFSVVNKLFQHPNLGRKGCNFSKPVNGFV